MIRRPLFLWIFPELIQDNRWQHTYFSKLPLELLVKIFQHKWFVERNEAKQELVEYFAQLSASILFNSYRELRTVSAFNFFWVTPNGIAVHYNLKSGPGYLSKDITFSANLRVSSKHTQYLKIRDNKKILKDW